MKPLRYISKRVKITETHSMSLDNGSISMENKLIIPWKEDVILYPIQVIKNGHIPVYRVGETIKQLHVTDEEFQSTDTRDCVVVYNSDVIYDDDENNEQKMIKGYTKCDVNVMYHTVSLCDDFDFTIFKIIKTGELKVSCCHVDNILYIEREIDYFEHFIMPRKIIKSFASNSFYYVLYANREAHQISATGEYIDADTVLPDIIDIDKFCNSGIVCQGRHGNYIIHDNMGKIVYLPNKTIKKIFYDHIAFYDGTIVNEEGTIIRDIFDIGNQFICGYRLKKISCDVIFDF